jgi:protein TonB
MLDVSRKAYSFSATALSEPDQVLLSFADTLFRISSKKPPYFLIAAGAGVYLAALFVLVTVDFSPAPLTLEAPIEMSYEEAADEQPAETPPEPVAEKQPEPPPPPQVEKPPEPVPEPPPPVTETPPEPAPVAEVPPPPKEPEPKPEPLKEELAKPVETPQPEKPKAKPKATHTVGAVPSDYANKVFQRINRIATNSFPRIAVAQKAVRIGYVIVIGASGQLISKSVSGSGIAALDQAVAQALARSAPFPAPPNLGASSYRISGAIVYRVR